MAKSPASREQISNGSEKHLPFAICHLPFEILFLILFLPHLALADAGVLLPLNHTQPDPSILSLEEMWVNIQIDNGDARVWVRQIFSNHTVGVEEGTYIFALPSRATVSDFAVWDAVVRIPGVILERRRAEEVYNDLKWQSIDPGLLQMGERTADEARRTAVFSARIVPIPAYGTKRLEIEYHESIPVENSQSFFALPLRPDAYRVQTAGHLHISFELRSAYTLKDFTLVSKVYPFTIRESTAHKVKAEYDGRDVAFTEDFAVRYGLEASQEGLLQVLTHRDTAPAAPSPTESSPVPAKNEPGYFQASALVLPMIDDRRLPIDTSQIPAPANRQSKIDNRQSRTVVVLFDNSLSMQWEKLERSFRALEALLHSLRPADRFDLLLFNSEVKSFLGSPGAAEPAAVEKALGFVRSSYLRGGTDLQGALGRGLRESAVIESDPYLVLLTDGDATRGLINNARLASWYAGQWQQLPEGHRPHVYVFAVGDDANLPLLKLLAHNDGIIEWVRSTEPIEFKLNSFISKIGRRPIAGLRLSAAPRSNFEFVYPLQDTLFAGAEARWVGQYRQPATQATFTVQGIEEGRPLEMRTTAALPAHQPDHPQLPRLWARARVDALLEKIEREGEDQASVDEIIRLARRYKFVTPYTSFLAAPRALLRPRVIRPGDPVLRVKTDASIVSVVALFPFGLIKKLRYLPQEDTWQTRFLAPAGMVDGTYSVRLILRDRVGHVYREQKSFVIVSKPPVVRVKLDKSSFRRGEQVRLRASASDLTRTVVARMAGVPPIQLRWDPKAGSNTAQLTLPEQLAAGRYLLTVTAEDIAHNIGSEEVPIEVLP
jgi:Ca-activated chloride channel homolog